jgi:predicted enzyme related to lactoylglutathione lyase
VTVVNVLTTLTVSDFDAAVAWYEQLFGRPADRRPMDGLAEWQLSPTGGVQVYRGAEEAGASAVVISVDDIDAHTAELARRGFQLETFDTPSGLFRLATIEDPAGNAITFSQALPTG